MILPNPYNFIKLCKVPLNNSYEHQLVFDGLAFQRTYFENKDYMTVTEFSYVRQPYAHNNVEIKLPYNIEQIRKYNYLFYTNDMYNDKLFYCFIEKYNYINESTTGIEISLDYWQTYMFDIQYNECYIERATPYDLYLPENTISDNIDVGQQVRVLSKEIYLRGAYFVFCTCDVTKEDVSTSTPISLSIGNYKFPCYVLYFKENNTTDLSRVLQEISQKGLSDRILSAVYVPAFDPDEITTKLSSSYGGIEIVTNISKASFTQDVEFGFGHVEREFGKELTYPYSKIILQDNSTGQILEYAPEKFNNGIAKFRILTVLCEQPYYKIIPMGYCGEDLSYSNAIVVKCNTGLPIANNLYSKYLMNNGEFNNLAKMSTMGNGILGGIGSIMKGDVLGTASGAFNTYMGIQNINAQESQATKLGNSVTAIHDGCMERVNFNNRICMSLVQPDYDHMKMLRDYWKKYGYPMRKLGYVNHRNTPKDYYFIKTQDSNITGLEVPQHDLIKIKQMFDNGITLWKNPKTMYIYN